MEKLLDRQVCLTESEEKTSYLTSRINLSSRIRGDELSGFYIKRMFSLLSGAACRPGKALSHLWNLSWNGKQKGRAEESLEGGEEGKMWNILYSITAVSHGQSSHLEALLSWSRENKKIRQRQQQKIPDSHRSSSLCAGNNVTALSQHCLLSMPHSKAGQAATGNGFG